MTHYDPQIIRLFADRLYSHARTVAAVYGVAGLLLLGGGGYAAASTNGGMIGGLVGLLVGIAAGVQAGFKLKLQAQVALCQLTIEENTRTGR